MPEKEKLSQKLEQGQLRINFNFQQGIPLFNNDELFQNIFHFEKKV